MTKAIFVVAMFGLATSTATRTENRNSMCGKNYLLSGICSNLIIADRKIASCRPPKLNEGPDQLLNAQHPQASYSRFISPNNVFGFALNGNRVVSVFWSASPDGSFLKAVQIRRLRVSGSCDWADQVLHCAAKSGGKSYEFKWINRDIQTQSVGC